MLLLESAEVGAVGVVVVVGKVAVLFALTFSSRCHYARLAVARRHHCPLLAVYFAKSFAREELNQEEASDLV